MTDRERTEETSPPTSMDETMTYPALTVSVYGWVKGLHLDHHLGTWFQLHVLFQTAHQNH